MIRLLPEVPAKHAVIAPVAIKTEMRNIRVVAIKQVR